ncbi:protein MAIN-LIKE 2-like [Mercurialis annua]|uniref:protein MAIN-LIKE 2-like n=1 Tax=Mercurialis annua TaxID=3986 RepID=UPI00215E4061|nr:protein MAIN-LIKE 2-like [Mercurialis annua]
MEEVEIIVEKNEQIIVSSTNSNPISRTAYFLNPTHASTQPPIPKTPSSLSCAIEFETCPLKVSYNGWKYPTEKWKSWVHRMEAIHRSVWKRAGIYDAVMSSVCCIKRDDGLMMGLAQKWCPETNTFVFPWAEATITLEDVMILGGFFVLGSPIFPCSLESNELEEIEKKLNEARNELGRGSSHKASTAGWMNMFMFSDNEIEHEAFLSYWLATFVFYDSERILNAQVFPIAIRLAKGEIVALAPPVLASIYRDLGLLKATLLSVSEIETTENCSDVLTLTLWSPFHLVQLWAWERFPAFRKNPNFVKNGEPRSALWHNVKIKKVRNVKLALDSAANTFWWRPYTTRSDSSYLPNIYKEKAEWKDLETNPELFQMALCLRISELVGLSCVEQYLPHRVARQFGLDQDIPSEIVRPNEFPELAWINYIRPFGHNAKLYVPSKFSEPGVTPQYFEWWNKQAVLGGRDMLKDAISSVVRKKRSSRGRSKWVSLNCHIRDSYEVFKPAIEEMMRSCEIKSVDNKVFGGLEEKTNGETEIPTCSTHDSTNRVEEEKETSTKTFEIPGLELEDRISVLEKAIAKLKAERFGSNCC